MLGVEIVHRENIDTGEILLYDSNDNGQAVTVRLADESVWLTQAQMVELFQRNKRTISGHIRNVFTEGELVETAVVRKSRTTAADGKSYITAYYNLDVIISVGYRVKSQRGTQFRIWATKVLRDHLVKGYTYNQQRLAERGVHEAQQVLALLTDTLKTHELVREEGLSVLAIVNRYARTWRLLLQYDENRLPMPTDETRSGQAIDLVLGRELIASLKNELMARGEATELFGNERKDALPGILGAICQTFAGHDLYPTREEKAANLLYLIIKDHPFTDGNKRIGSFLFLMYLQREGLYAEAAFDDKALVALTLLTAASDPGQKDTLIRLIVNLLGPAGGG